MRARINWKSEAEGGRRSLPSGEGERPYTTEVRFLDEPWPANEAWSLEVEKLGETEDQLSWDADVRFLVPEAPHEALSSGRQFELYEGRKCVAAGRLL